MKREKTINIVTGTIGQDCHIVGIWIITQSLKRAGFNVHYLGGVVSQEEFIEAAIETNADAILVSSSYGMGRIDCEGMREKCIESGLEKILLYAGGTLVPDAEEWTQTKKLFEKTLSFSRAFPPETKPSQIIETLKEDLRKVGHSLV